MNSDKESDTDSQGTVDYHIECSGQAIRVQESPEREDFPTEPENHEQFTFQVDIVDGSEDSSDNQKQDQTVPPVTFDPSSRNVTHRLDHTGDFLFDDDLARPGLKIEEGQLHEPQSASKSSFEENLSTPRDNEMTSKKLLSSPAKPETTRKSRLYKFSGLQTMFGIAPSKIELPIPDPSHSKSEPSSFTFETPNKGACTERSGVFESADQLAKFQTPADLSYEESEITLEDVQLLVEEQRFKERTSAPEQSWLGALLTVVQYLRRDIKKKRRTFQIGVFTIVLVVSFAAFLQSAVDVAPVVFLKTAQDEGGAFDFQMVADYSAKLANGDKPLYGEDPFTFKAAVTEEEEEPTLFEQLAGQTVDRGDHFSFMGFNLLNFGDLKQRLDPLKETGLFKGFAPRWTLPTKLRSLKESARNTSCVLLIIDSEREADFGFGTGFSDEIIGKSEVMVSSAALRQLGAAGDRKEIIEIFFDIQTFLKTLSATATDKMSEDLDQVLSGHLSKTSMGMDVLREEFKLQLEANDTVTVDIKKEVLKIMEYSSMDLTMLELPTLNLTRLLPFFDVSSIANWTLDDSNTHPFLHDISVLDLFTGELDITLGELLDLMEETGISKVNIPIDKVLETMIDILDFPESIASNFTVIDSIENSKGKFGSQLGNVALIDCKYANALMEQTFTGLVDNLFDTEPVLFLFFKDTVKQMKESIASVDFCNYALAVYGATSDQVGMYSSKSEEKLGHASNMIAQAMTLEANVSMTTPLKTELEEVELLKIFMNTNMTTVVAFLLILCVQLVYSLMLSDVDDKTYEYGMLRALGFNTKNIMATISMQAFFFSVPGLLIGLGIAALLNYGLRYALWVVTGNKASFWLSKNSLVLALVVGVMIPICSNILPIKRALGKNLRQSLDLARSSNDDLKLSIRKMKNLGLSPSQTIFSVMLIVGGFFTYYVAPSAYLFENYTLFFFILNCLLLGMILGLTLLVILILPQVQKAFLWIFLLVAPRDRKLKFMIAKNMEKHKGRNTKTAIMFAISLSFLIFSGSTFMLLGEMIVSEINITAGSDLYGIAATGEKIHTMLDEGPITEFLEEQKRIDGAVNGYTFISYDLATLMQKISPHYEPRTFFSDVSGYKQLQFWMYSVQEDYTGATYSQYAMGSEYSKKAITAAKEAGASIPKVDGYYDPIALLYSNASRESPVLLTPQVEEDPVGVTAQFGDEDDLSASDDRNYYETLSVLVPEGLRDVLSIDTKQGGRFCVKFGPKSGCINPFKMDVRGMMTKMPSWYFSGYSSVQYYGQVLLPEPQYKAILDDYIESAEEEVRQNFQDLIKHYNFTNDVPKYRMLVKLSPNVTVERRDFIANGIRSFFRDDTTVLIDVQAQLEQVETALTVFQGFVVIVGVIALTLAFFLLLVQTTQSIRESTNEFGCQRAIGLTKAQGLRCFMYEQYSVVLSSLTLGTLVGFIVASIVTAQFFLFLELPFKLSFPSSLVLLMYTMALLTTFFAVYRPVQTVNSKSVASVVKGHL